MIRSCVDVVCQGLSWRDSHHSRREECYEREGTARGFSANLWVFTLGVERRKRTSPAEEQCHGIVV